MALAQGTLNKIHKLGGREADFLANVIETHHSKAYTKLRGLVNLLVLGHSVRTGQFDIDVLVVDGERKPWTFLEQASRINFVKSLSKQSNPQKGWIPVKSFRIVRDNRGRAKKLQILTSGDPSKRWKSPSWKKAVKSFSKKYGRKTGR